MSPHVFDQADPRLGRVAIRSIPACWVLIPIKAPGQGKTRLAGVLDTVARERLVSAMLERVIAAAQGCPAIARVCVLSTAARNLGENIAILADHGGGLNCALGEALRTITPNATSRVIVVAADLPQIEALDFAMLADVADDAIAIAPDRHGTGTNGLSLPFAALATFKPQFGSDSHAAHRTEAARLGYRVETMMSAGLEKDVDVPRDLTDAEAYLG